MRRLIFGSVGSAVAVVGFIYFCGGSIQTATHIEYVFANAAYLIIALLGFIAGAIVAGTKE